MFVVDIFYSLGGQGAGCRLHDEYTLRITFKPINTARLVGAGELGAGPPGHAQLHLPPGAQVRQRTFLVVLSPFCVAF